MLLEALEQSLVHLDLEDSDQAAVELARTLAKAIDQETSGRTLAELASKFNAILTDLGASPAARKALKGGTVVPIQGVSPLQKLRAARA